MGNGSSILKGESLQNGGRSKTLVLIIYGYSGSFFIFPFSGRSRELIRERIPLHNMLEVLKQRYQEKVTSVRKPQKSGVRHCRAKKSKRPDIKALLAIFISESSA